MRALGATLAVVVALGAGAAIAAGQGAVPTVTVTASSSAVSAAPTPVAPGATRFAFVASGLQRESGVYLAAVKPGRTVDEVIAAVRTNPDTSFELADIVASVALAPGATRAVTVDIEPGTTYLLVNDTGAEATADWVIAPLATGGAPTGATAPAPDADVLMRDVRFGGDTTLPRDGTVRVRNIGWAPHFAIAAPLRAGARKAAVGRAIRGNRERALGRLLNFGGAVELTNILTRGAVADQEVTFRRRGRHVLVCFFENHNAHGMYRFVTVR